MKVLNESDPNLLTMLRVYLPLTAVIWVSVATSLVDSRIGAVADALLPLFTTDIPGGVVSLPVSLVAVKL